MCKKALLIVLISISYHSLSIGITPEQMKLIIKEKRHIASTLSSKRDAIIKASNNNNLDIEIEKEIENNLSNEIKDLLKETRENPTETEPKTLAIFIKKTTAIIKKILNHYSPYKKIIEYQNEQKMINYIKEKMNILQKIEHEHICSYHKESIELGTLKTESSCLDNIFYTNLKQEDCAELAQYYTEIKKQMIECEQKEKGILDAFCFWR